MFFFFFLIFLSPLFCWNNSRKEYEVTHGKRSVTREERKKHVRLWQMSDNWKPGDRIRETWCEIRGWKVECWLWIEVFNGKMEFDPRLGCRIAKQDAGPVTSLIFPRVRHALLDSASRVFRLDGNCLHFFIFIWVNMRKILLGIFTILLKAFRKKLSGQ